MPVKAIFLSLGFLVSWLVFLPVLVIGGGMALLAGATLAEIGAWVTGSSRSGVDTSRAHEIARSMCGGYSSAPARVTQRR